MTAGDESRGAGSGGAESGGAGSGGEGSSEDENDERVESDIDELLQELRVVNPGTQTLLGFQFAVFFATGFGKLQPAQQALHLANLLLVAMSVALLFTPVAMHQLEMGGADNEKTLRTFRRALLAGMAFLAMGLCGDVFVAADITLHDDLTAAILAAALFAFIAFQWYVRNIARQWRRNRGTGRNR